MWSSHAPEGGPGQKTLAVTSAVSASTNGATPICLSIWPTFVELMLTANRVVEDGRLGQRLATVDDPVPDADQSGDRLDPDESQGPVQGGRGAVGVPAFERHRRRSERSVATALQDARLERARAGVEDEGPPRLPVPGTHPGQVQSRISGSSSPWSRV